MVYNCIGSNDSSWAGKTSQEIREIGEKDGSILIVPVGSIEQHGNHLPVSTDTILVDAMAHLGADRVRDDVPILITPPLWSGYSPHHLPFGGTLTLNEESLLNAIEEVSESALENNFDALLLLNGHGGNSSLVSSATGLIGRKDPGVEVLGLTYFNLADGFIDDIRDSDLGGMGHAGEFETSLMLFLRPELVHEEEFEESYLTEPYELVLKDMFAGGPLSVYRPFTEYSETGVIGDPTLASADKGEEIYNRLGDELESVLAKIHKRNN